MFLLIFPPENTVNKEGRPCPHIRINPADVFPDQADAEHLNPHEEEQDGKQRENTESTPTVPICHNEPPGNDVKPQQKTRQPGENPEIGQNTQRECGHAGQQIELQIDQFPEGIDIFARRWEICRLQRLRQMTSLR